MTTKSGFTLAEVLITLGIIGVVAAMTIPTLIANTNSAKFRSQYKKAVSTLSQAGLMAQAQYDMDYSIGGACNVTNPASDDPEVSTSFCAILNGTLSGKTAYGHLTDVKNKSGASYSFSSVINLSSEAYYMAYTLADGALVGFRFDASDCTVSIGSSVSAGWLGSRGSCLGFIDVNGAALPNKEVTCGGTTATTLSPNSPCSVPNDAQHITDIFPIVFHDATVEPATNASKYILTSAK